MDTQTRTKERRERTGKTERPNGKERRKEEGGGSAAPGLDRKSKGDGCSEH